MAMIHVVFINMNIGFEVIGISEKECVSTHNQETSSRCCLYTYH